MSTKDDIWFAKDTNEDSLYNVFMKDVMKNNGKEKPVGTVEVKPARWEVIVRITEIELSIAEMLGFLTSLKRWLNISEMFTIKFSEK